MEHRRRKQEQKRGAQVRVNSGSRVLKRVPRRSEACFQESSSPISPTTLFQEASGTKCFRGFLLFCRFQISRPDAQKSVVTLNDQSDNQSFLAISRCLKALWLFRTIQAFAQLFQPKCWRFFSRHKNLPLPTPA